MNEQSLFMNVIRSSKTQFRNKVESVSRQLVKRKETITDSLISLLIFLGIRGVRYLLKKAPLLLKKG